MNLIHLGKDILTKIIFNVDSRSSISSLMQTCRTFYQIIKNPDIQMKLKIKFGLVKVSSYHYKKLSDDDKVFYLPGWRSLSSLVTFMVESLSREVPIKEIILDIGSNICFQYSLEEIKLISQNDNIFVIESRQDRKMFRHMLKIRLDKLFHHTILLRDIFRTYPCDNGILHCYAKYSKVFFLLKLNNPKNIIEMSFETYQKNLINYNPDYIAKQMQASYLTKRIIDQSMVYISPKHAKIEKFIFCDDNDIIFSIIPHKYSNYIFKIHDHAIEYLNEKTVIDIDRKIVFLMIKYQVSISAANDLYSFGTNNKPLIKIRTNVITSYFHYSHRIKY